MKKTYAFILILGVTGALGGCYVERDVDVTPPHNTSVKRSTLSLQVPFGPHHPTLSHEEAAQLRSYIRRVSWPGPVYARLVVRKLHSRFDDPMTDRRVVTVTRFLTQEGVALHRIEVLEEGNQENAKTETENGMWIGIDHYAVLPPRCPGFDAQVMDRKVSPAGESNFGCSVEYNFAKMVAEPKDIYKGHTLSSSDPTVQSRAVERFRTDKVKALKIERAGTVNAATSSSGGGGGADSGAGGAAGAGSAISALAGG